MICLVWAGVCYRFRLLLTESLFFDTKGKQLPCSRLDSEEFLSRICSNQLGIEMISLSLLIWETYNNKVTEDWTCGFQLNASAQPILLCTCGSSKMANLVEKIRTQYGLLFNNRIYLNGRLWRFHWNAGKSPNKKIKKKSLAFFIRVHLLRFSK